MAEQNCHPIVPPPELVRQWMERTKYDEHTWFYESYIAEQAARWGADQELEACCEHISKWFVNPCYRVDELRDARRPKPPSLKQQALTELDSLENMGACNADTIRRALESLPD